MNSKTVLPSTRLSHEVKTRIARQVKMFPEGRQQSALIEGLRAAQESNGGYLTPELTSAVADELGVPAVMAQSVAAFYSMLETQAVGRNAVSVCTNVSCMLRGGDEILKYIETRLGIKAGQSTTDNRVYLKREEECLAACTGAPMMMVNHRYHENLTPQIVDELLDGLE